MDAIHDFLRDLSAFFGTVTGIKEVETLRGDLEYMQEVAERVEEILAKNGNEVAKNNNTTAESGVRYLVGVSQKDIDEYVENAFENNGKNTEYIKYAPVSDRLAADIGNEIADNKSYNHALRDNDIRHIRNSHGERTNEKYPVTESDIEKIPEIVEFYDKVYKVKNNGIYYVKVYDGGVVYYLEQATTQHGKDKLLINKQMIKSSTDTLPTLKSLIDAINKKEGTTKFLNDLKNPSGHIRNGVSSTSINSISDSSKKSNSKKLVLDRDYMQAARNGDEEKAAEYVEQAAKEWGAFSDGKPAPINLYHGTKSFGFTEFDLQKMDDKRSIFLTSDEVSAQSYSSVMGKRKISDAPKQIDYRNMSKKELVDALNEYSVFNDEYDLDYTYLSKEQIESLIASKTEEIEELRDMLTEELRDSSMPQQKSDSIHRLLEIVNEGTTGQITANLYMATNSKSNAYLDVAKYESIYDRIYRISLFEDTDKDISDGAIMETMGTGYYEIIPEKEAKGILKNWSSNTAGNYSLYAKFNNPFVIDNEGRLWRDIKLNDEQQNNLLPKEAFARMSDFISRLEKQWDLDEGWISADDFIKNLKESREKVDAFKRLIYSAHAEEFDTTGFPWGEYSNGSLYLSDLRELTNFIKETYTTRQIAERAQKAGYDGVVFKNIRDNGGRGMKNPGVADYIAVAFDSSQVKSADPITYDDNGEIIPLSERFSDDKDIRYSFGNKKITPNMSDEERAEVLKNTELSPVDDKSEEYGVITSDYDGIKSKIEKPLRDKLREIGAFRKYSSKAIDFDFEFTVKKGFYKSTHQQLKYGGDYPKLAKVLSNLQELFEKAVLIETHFDRDIGTKFEKPYAKQFYVLMSVLKDEESLIPVQFEIIEYNNDDNKLYIAVAMSKIAASDIMEESIFEKEKEVDVAGHTSLNEQDGTNLLSTSTYSIREIFKNINPKDKLFLKYVPDEFLSEEQISAKREALEEEKKRRIKTKSSDNAYMQAVKNSNEQEQQRLVDKAAEKAFTKSKIRDDNGKLIKVYHGTFADFTEFDSSKGRTNMDIKGSFFSPWDIDAAGYGPNVRAFYLNITNPAPEAVAYKALNSHKGENGAGEKARNDLIKMGYNGVNNSDEEYIAFYPEQIKSADPVTYDDNGEVIPLSERFSESKDIRYSVKDETLQASAAEHFGTTYNWNETGYILKNGKRLDFSGKNYGARGGYRTIDHRDIDDVYNDELFGTEAMIDFINRGNIRIMPEVGGVELSAVPTKAQKEALDSFISKYRGKITLDISDENGDNLLSVEYPRGTFSKKILNDIEQYFENGTEPYISDTARFRYSVLDRNDIQKALDKRERQIFYSAINPLTQNDGLRIGENGILIPSEDTADTYKLIHYTNIGSVQVHDVYKLINHDYNIHEIIPDVAKHIIELREEGYNEKHTQSILKSFSSLYGTVFKKYSPKSHRFVNYARSGNRNGTVNRPQPTGTGVFERIRQNGSSAKQLVYDTAIIDTIRDQEAELVQVCRSTRRKPAAETVREPPFWRVALLLFIYLFFLFGGFQKLVAQCCEGGACKRGDNKNPKGCERLCISGNGGDQGGADTSCRVNRSAGKPDTQNMHKGKC